jgi:hypothetical protein
MAEIDDDEWLKALAGRPSGDLPEDVRREIAALREAIKKADERSPLTSQETDQQLNRLLSRLRSEGLLERQSSWKSPITAVPLAATAVLVIALSVLLFLPRELPEQDINRGGQKIQVIEVNDVERSLAQISETLRKEGIEPKTYPLGLHRGLHVSIPVEKRDAIRPSLESLGVKIPADGELRLEIREKSVGG